ncbi:MAG: FAD-dependent oxidoreductase [Coriobacteriia bacterium]|nr:FAD-dependent oxidoreductase [Coriobacteriia bacterium]
MALQMIDIAVIGGGPAGLTAGLYGARGGARTVIFERQAAGGQIITTDCVENYPAFPDGISGAELGERMAAQASAQGAEIALFTEVTAIRPVDGGEPLAPFLVIASGAEGEARQSSQQESEEEVPILAPAGGGFLLETTDPATPFFARAVIVATGAVPVKLGIPGEDAYTGRGVSWCATCDGAFYRDKVVAVIGGGDAALEEAIFLTKFASRVYLVHRRQEFRAAQVIVERIRSAATVELVLGYVSTEIIGDKDSGKVSGLRLRNVADDSERVLEVAGVFEFVGTAPISALVARDLVATDERGYIYADSDGATDLPGLFAAGDVTDGSLKQVVTAAGAGAAAGFAALHYLEKSA